MDKNSKIFFSNSIDEQLLETKKLPITLSRAGFVFDQESNLEDTLCSVQLIGKNYKMNNSILISNEYNTII